MTDTNPVEQLVNVIIDGKKIAVPKGINLIEAAKRAGIEIPYYCYHPNLSIAGNCRMCQVQVKGQPKLTIGCNTTVTEGMEVMTHLTSKEVADTQAATLEFILINHPLDCTVCDQAGHCKLQDYHYEYNARPSRFIENKVHKVKAVPLGPTVMLDGERCIMCTRCVRFCDEIPGTSELGMMNRGDRSVIAVNPDKPLSNPFSGTVVDLCPVGALTHSNWRFNTRIWYTNQVNTVCTGCSTGCNVRVATRDGAVVQVKARVNDEVNKEWLCDEGRYGFGRFLPEHRFLNYTIKGEVYSEATFIEKLQLDKNAHTAVLLSPDLLLEDYVYIRSFIESYFLSCEIALQYRERKLSPIEAKLISPDFACNFAGALFSGIMKGHAGGHLESKYDTTLKHIREREFSQILILGERALLERDCDEKLLQALSSAQCSLSSITESNHPALSYLQNIIPGRSILERSGLLVNRGKRLQYSTQLFEPPEATVPEWRFLNALSKKYNLFSTDALSDRDATMSLLKASFSFIEGGNQQGIQQLNGLKIAEIKRLGIKLQ
jgi:NADH-quinone oxidoreductase subunit G